MFVIHAMIPRWRAWHKIVMNAMSSVLISIFLLPEPLHSQSRYIKQLRYGSTQSNKQLNSKSVSPVIKALTSLHNGTTDNDITGKNYIGLTEGTFKQRYTQHKLSFRNRKYANRTELAKHIWKLKDNKENLIRR